MQNCLLSQMKLLLLPIVWISVLLSLMEEVEERLSTIALLDVFRMNEKVIRKKIWKKKLAVSLMFLVSLKQRKNVVWLFLMNVRLLFLMMVGNVLVLVPMINKVKRSLLTH